MGSEGRVGKAGRGPGVREGKRLGNQWRGVRGEEVRRGASLDNQLLERKPSVTLGHGQNLCQGWYSVLQNLKWRGVLGQVWKWRICKLFPFLWDF